MPLALGVVPNQKSVGATALVTITQASTRRQPNLGDDADTTAAIVGQLAGAYYGLEAIPDRWLTLLHMRTDIEGMAAALHARAAAR